MAALERAEARYYNAGGKCSMLRLSGLKSVSHTITFAWPVSSSISALRRDAQ
jgi:hypothetical protein